MPKHLVFEFAVFHSLLFAGVFGFVPSPTNISVVCHNFVNVLYWNYSNPTEQLKFSVKIGGYLSGSQTVDTPQTYLDISSYSSDVGDNYLVLVTAHDGQEKSESVSIKFTYSQDFIEGKNPKCSLDFPAVNTSVHKDMIEVSIQHPFFLHKQDILKERFTYTVTHDEQIFSHSCFVKKDKLCTMKIHLNESTAGQCVELKFKGKIAGIPLNTYRNVCVPQQIPETVLVVNSTPPAVALIPDEPTRTLVGTGLLHQLTVPSPTNISVVCHNFVNVLYWNYSNPTEQMKFSVKIGGYLSGSQTVDTPQTYLDISSYSSDVGDNYLVLVTAHDGQEKSESVSIKFSYSQDFIEGKNPKCSLDFPAVNTSVHKDMIEVSIQHPFFLHKQDILKERFTYTVTHDEQIFSHSCFVKDEMCTVKIHLNESTAGQCVELKFEGKIAGIPLNTYRNVCVPQQIPETVNQTGLIGAVLGGGTVMLLVIIGFVWLFLRKLSKIPKIPEFLRNGIPGQSPPTQPESTAISAMTSQGHTPLLTDVTFSYGSPPISPNEKDCKENTLLDETVVRLPEISDDVNCGDSENFGFSSDYDSHKFLHEMSPGDITEGYGPRPPVL